MAILTSIITYIRTIVVFIVGTGSTFIFSFLAVLLVRDYLNRGVALESIATTLIGYFVIGIALIWLFCLLAFHVFSFWKTTRIGKAIRVSEAMQMLHAYTHQERLETIRHYAIRIYRTKKELPLEITENVACKEISTFLSPMFFRIDKLSALGSSYYCCDFGQIQTIISSNSTRWGQAISNSTDIDRLALERKFADLQAKNTDVTKKYTAAAGREGILKQQLAEMENHMAILIELTNKVTNEFKPPRKITTNEIKKKYIAIGKLRGITKAPGEYVEIFRVTMPKDIINWGGAPKQSSGIEKT